VKTFGKGLGEPVLEDTAGYTVSLWLPQMWVVAADAKLQKSQFLLFK